MRIKLSLSSAITQSMWI